LRADQFSGTYRSQVEPEGHNIEYDEAGRIVGMTLTNVRWLLDRDGQVTITPARWSRQPG